MSNFVILNVIVSLFAIIFSVAFIKSKKELAAVLKSSIIITLVAYPWDYFAITLGVWVFPEDPGPLLYKVPFNDIWLFFTASIMSTSLLGHLIVFKRNT